MTAIICPKHHPGTLTCNAELLTDAFLLGQTPQAHGFSLKSAWKMVHITAELGTRVVPADKFVLGRCAPCYCSLMRPLHTDAALPGALLQGLRAAACSKLPHQPSRPHPAPPEQPRHPLAAPQHATAGQPHATQLEE